MKRLKSFLIELDRKDNTYRKIYEGPMYDPYFDEVVYDPTYWKDGISYHFERSYRHTLDKPIVCVQIPLTTLIGEIVLSFQGNEDCISDYLLREFNKQVDLLNLDIKNTSRPHEENGYYYTFYPTNEIVQRNASYLTNEINDGHLQYYLNLMILVQLPKGNHRKAAQMLCSSLPNAVARFLSDFNPYLLAERIDTYKKQNQIREWLKTSQYCSFIANGSILPRESNTCFPLKNAIPFKSTSEDEIVVCGLKGMGIKRGVTVITGGGYSGKSTLIEAIAAGIFNHVPLDGREYVITDSSAMNIQAEDGRAVRNVNISPFIKWLPDGDPKHFSTDHASGSTSQAANIIEAIQYGSKVLLIDEDKSATNFMIQDKTMRSLIKHDPIVPFTDRVEQLYSQLKISTILVIGGSSEYFSVCNEIILMDNFFPSNITGQIVAEKKNILIDNIQWFQNRFLNTNGFSPYPKNMTKERFELSEFGFLLIGDEIIDLRMLRNFISREQMTAAAFVIRKLELTTNLRKINVYKEVSKMLQDIKETSLNEVLSTHFKSTIWLEAPRVMEVYAIINRMKHVMFIEEEK